MTLQSTEYCEFQQWYCVANDEVLWRHLVFVMVRKRAILPPDKENWREEYKRLTHHIPQELSQDVAGHQDEIYYLTFSPSGRFLASVGKDGTCRVDYFSNFHTTCNLATWFLICGTLSQFNIYYSVPLSMTL